jgi:hypothetical protein
MRAPNTRGRFGEKADKGTLSLPENRLGSKANAWQDFPNLAGTRHYRSQISHPTLLFW